MVSKLKWMKRILPWSLRLYGNFYTDRCPTYKQMLMLEEQVCCVYKQKMPVSQRSWLWLGSEALASLWQKSIPLGNEINCAQFAEGRVSNCRHVEVEMFSRTVGTGGWCAAWGPQLRLNQTLQFDWCLAASEVFHLLLCERKSSSSTGIGHRAFREKFREGSL